MILSDWLAVIIPVMALVVLYLDKKIPKRYGGHMVGRIKVEDHFPSFTKDGKPLPGKWHKRQAIIGRLRCFFLWAIVVVGIVVFILRKLGW